METLFFLFFCKNSAVFIFLTQLANFKDPTQSWDRVTALWTELHLAHAPLFFWYNTCNECNSLILGTLRQHKKKLDWLVYPLHFLIIRLTFYILRKWNSKRAKITTHPLSFPIPSPPTGWTNQPIDEFRVSKINWRHFFSVIYPRIFYYIHSLKYFLNLNVSQESSIIYFTLQFTKCQITFSSEIHMINIKTCFFVYLKNILILIFRMLQHSWE